METLVQSKSRFNLYMLGLVQQYLEIYRFRRSVNIEHSITKWYSSSIVLHVVHFLFSRGIQCGRCHPPVSIRRLWEESINLDNAAVKVVTKLHLQNWNSRIENLSRSPFFKSIVTFNFQFYLTVHCYHASIVRKHEQKHLRYRRPEQTKLHRSLLMIINIEHTTYAYHGLSRER